MLSIYATDSYIQEEGHGGGVVSFHELNALKKVTEVRNIYQRIGKLRLETLYPNNPFMYDYYLATQPANTNEIRVAMFYGSFLTLTMKRFANAKKFCTIPAHNLERSIEEWTKFGFTGVPPIHLTDDWLFMFGCKGIAEDIDQIICPSRASAEFVKRKYGKEAVIIPHGTDIPKEYTLNRLQEFNVFHLGQFGHDKGQIYLVAAWKEFMIQHNDVKLTLAGSDTFRDFVALCMGQYPESVECFGIIEPERKKLLYMSSSVYVQPSVTEGWGLPVGEAMSYGTPVIVAEGAGAADMVTDGQDGFIVPIRDSGAILDKLNYFYNNPDEVKRMGANARAKSESYSWDRIEDKYARLIKDVAGI